jgi:DNA-binding SARP family transcriptional activator
MGRHGGSIQCREPGFLILGPLLVIRDGEPVPLGRGKLRTLLAILLLHANEAVPLGYIADRLWGDEPVAGPRGAIQTYVTRLRQALGAGDLIETTADGRLIRVAADRLDLARFDRLTRAADEEPDPARAYELLGEAVGLWRGPALADVRSEVVRSRDVPRLDERRRRAEEAFVETALTLGRHARCYPGRPAAWCW